MKKALLFFIFALVLSSCSKSEAPAPTPQAIVTLSDGSSVSDNVEMTAGNTVKFSAKCDNAQIRRCDWYIDGQLKSVADYLEFSPVQPGTYEIKLIVTAYGESQATVVFSVTVYGPYKSGTYILVEGNMSSDNGSICFVDENGTFYSDPYGQANLNEGRPTSPGNVLQDMFIYKDKAYFVTQNGTSQGQGARLVKCDAQTLKAEKFYTGSIDDETVWPQHIVVVNENKAYIRWSQSGMETTSGIRVMNLATGQWSPESIEGTEGAFTVSGSTKARMLLQGDKVYAPCGKYLKIIDTNTDKVIKTIDFGATRQTKDIAKGHDGNIYMLVSGTFTGGFYSPTYGSEATVVCIKPSDDSYTEKELPAEMQMPVATWSPNVGMCASFTEDALFFRMGTGYSTSVVARYEYKTGTAKKLLDVSGQSGLGFLVYGYLGVDKNDVLYVGTTDYSNSMIGTFDAKTGARLEKTYQIRSGSPAGIDFTYRFSDEYLGRN